MPSAWKSLSSASEKFRKTSKFKDWDLQLRRFGGRFLCNGGLWPSPANAERKP